MRLALARGFLEVLDFLTFVRRTAGLHVAPDSHIERDRHKHNHQRANAQDQEQPDHSHDVLGYQMPA